MKLKIVFCAVLAAASLAYAGDGDLKPVKTRLDDGPALLRPLVTYNFRTVAADSGTVSDKARMAVFVIDGRFINVAIDSSTADAETPDCIRIDFAGKGDFKNAVVLSIETKQYQDYTESIFGPKMVEVKIGEDTIPVTISGSYLKSGTRRMMELSLVTAMQGECAFGDKTYPVRLYDGNANLLFGDRLAPVKQANAPGGIWIKRGDVLVVDTGNGKFTEGASLISAGYGQPICLGDKMYKVELSEEKLKLAVTASDAKPGKITVAHADWSAVLVGDEYVLYLSGGDKPIAVPPDNYRLFEYTETKDKWKVVQNDIAREPRVFKVAQGDSLKLEIGSPLTVTASIVLEKGTLSITSPKLLDSSGNNVVIQNPQGQQAEPTIEVYNSDGKQIHTGRFQYG